MRLMKKLYFIILSLILFSQVLSADVFRGYIVTKSGTHLMGYIGHIMHSNYRCDVVFINDFGTPYRIHPALIRGFVFKKGNEIAVYESKFDRRNWMFLKVLYKGEGMSLYKAPEERTQMALIGGRLQTTIVRSHEYWMELKGRQLMRIKRPGYKDRFRKLIEKHAPDLAEKIGQKGYKFKDIMKIVEEFNLEYSKGKGVL
jgi:hypothetical protein